MVHIDNNILQEALDLGIIDVSHVQAQVDMYNKKAILLNHPYKIWIGKDGFWRTYLPDEEKTRKLIKKKEKEALEEAIVNFYKDDEALTTKTFDEMYHLWREVQDIMVCSNTTVKYDTDYLRYFSEKDFIKKDIGKIKQSDIKVFICETVKTQHLCKKACKTLFGYIHNTFLYALEQELIADDPMKALKAKSFYKYCTEREKTTENSTVSDQEMESIYEVIQRDYQEQPWYIPTYAVHLASLTGMRVGELSALKWDCIKDNYILINKSEKYDRKNEKYIVDKTKTMKERKFPITPEIKSLLDKIKKIEIKYGYICEWVFADENGRVHANIISSCSKNKSRQAGIPDKGIHAFRKTINSKLRCNGVSATIAASMLGHSEEVNEEYYTFDVVSMEEKARLLSSAVKGVV